MSETETPPAAVEGAGAGTTVERPDYVPEKFWDNTAGQARVDELAKSYVALESAMGRRIQEVSADTRRIIAQALPDEVRGAWADELKGQLVADPEFLTPLEEAWRAKHLPKAPEAYEVPARGDGVELDPEHPLVAGAIEMAKKHGLPQEAFVDVVNLAIAARDGEPPVPPEQWKAVIPDIEQRAKAALNRLLAVAPDNAMTLMEQIRNPEAFLILEAVIKSGQPKALALEPAHHEGEPTKEKLQQMMRDPRYDSRSLEFDPSYHDMVTRGFNRLYNDHL